ncbi:MAG: pseudouridine synthase, partial [Lachnospiraceae bacterium]|nr:pseudouridine synthase [Lachnospiraceae bacterium]
MKEFTITKKDEGQSALKFMQRTLPSAPNSFFYKMMRKKNITLNGKKTEGNEKLKEGDVVKFFLSDETFDSFCANNKKNVSVSDYMEAYARFGKPHIVYEDDHIIVLNKPVDMLSQKAGKDDLSANEWLIGYLLYNKKITKEDLIKFTPSVCNRLDRNTGGLLLFGKTLFGTNILNTMLRERTG